MKEHEAGTPFSELAASTTSAMPASMSGKPSSAVCSAEIAGTRTTGPTLSTPPSNLGAGFYTGNNVDVEMFGCIAKANSRYGLVSHAGKLGIMGGSFTYNCQAPGAPGPGLFIRAGNAVRARSGGSPQTFGLVFDAANINAIYDGCDFTGNSGGAVFNSSTVTIKVGLNQRWLGKTAQLV